MRERCMGERARSWAKSLSWEPQGGRVGAAAGVETGEKSGFFGILLKRNEKVWRKLLYIE